MDAGGGVAVGVADESDVRREGRGVGAGGGHRGGVGREQRDGDVCGAFGEEEGVAGREHVWCAEWRVCEGDGSGCGGGLYAGV